MFAKIETSARHPHPSERVWAPHASSAVLAGSVTREIGP